MRSRFSRLLLPSAERESRSTTLESSSNSPSGPSESESSTQPRRDHSLRAVWQSVKSDLSRCASWCGERFEKLTEVRSLSDFARWTATTVRELGSGVLQAAARAFEHAKELKAALFDAFQQAEEASAAKRPGLGDLMTNLVRDEAAARERREPSEGSSGVGVRAPFAADPKTSSGSAEREAVHTASTVSAKLLDPATVSELRLARIFNHLPSPNTGEAERALAEADRNESSTKPKPIA